MAAMFPNHIRTLLVDDDAKFLKSAKELLSFLNFEVVICSNVDHALKILTSGDHHGFDVILVHAVKATASGFDFHAIIEANLLIPVIYFLPQGHEATNDKEDKLLRTLQAGTYVIKKPVDANEVRIFMWNVIASRKCELETKARRGIQQGSEDKGRVHKVVKGGGRKRKCSGSSPAGGSFACTATTAGGHPAAKGNENDNVASLQQPPQLKADGPGKKAQNSGSGEAFQLLQSNKAAMMNGAQLNFFMNAAMPPFNPSLFSVADGPSSNAGNFAGAVYSAVPSALPPAAHQQQQQQQQQQPEAHSTIFGNNMPSAAAPTMAEFSQVIGNQQPQDVHPLLMFGPFPYQGPSPPAAESGLFTVGSMAGGASVAAVAGAEARAYGNDVSLSFLQPPNHGAAQDADGEFADAAKVPQPFFRDAIDRATMEWLLSDDFDDYVGGVPPLIAPNHQVPGKASDVDEPTATAGNTNAAPLMVPLDQHLSVGNNGDLVAQEDVIHESVVGSDHDEGAGAAMDGNHAGLTAVAMAPCDDQYEDNTSSPLRDLYGPLSEFDDIIDLDFLLLAGGFSGGGAAVADDGDDAGTSLVASEEGGSNMDGLGNLDGLPIPYDLLENFMIP